MVQYLQHHGTLHANQMQKAFGTRSYKLMIPPKIFFALADGNSAAGSNMAKLYHNVREPAHTVDMVPALADF